MAQFIFEKETRFACCLPFGLAFCFLTTAFTTVVKASHCIAERSLL